MAIRLPGATGRTATRGGAARHAHRWGRGVTPFSAYVNTLAGAEGRDRTSRTPEEARVGRPTPIPRSVGDAGDVFPGDMDVDAGAAPRGHPVCVHHRVAAARADTRERARAMAEHHRQEGQHPQPVATDQNKIMKHHTDAITRLQDRPLRDRRTSGSGESGGHGRSLIADRTGAV